MLLSIMLSMLVSAQQTQQQEQAREFVSRFMIHGEVSIEGYGSAGSAATVSSSCGGMVQTNNEGRFVLSGISSNQGMTTCEITVSVAGCESRQVHMARPGGSISAGTITLTPIRKGPAAGTVSFLSLTAPPEVLKLREQARKSAAKEKLADAKKALERAVVLRERDPEAWFELGLVLKQLGDEKQAQAAFEKSSATDPRYALPYVQLELLALRRQDWAAAIRAGQSAVALNPTALPEAWLYLSTAYLKVSNPVEAEQAARHAVEKLPKAHHLLGVALAAQGRRADAVASLRQYLAAVPAATDAAMVTGHIRMLETQ